VCGEAGTGNEALKLAAELKPDIAILDVALPELDGLEVTRQIRRVLPDTQILIFTMYDEERLIIEAFNAGARAYLLKTDPDEKLLEAIDTLARHKPFFSERVSEALLEHFLKSPPDSAELSKLTFRQREIVRLLAEGKSNKEIASYLGISVKTVETHRATLMRKLGFKSITELVRFAIRNRLVNP
jgi:DNA-binding NarL/FixJ family response regulator